MTSKARLLLHAGYPIAALTLALLAPAPAKADFFDDVRRTFQTDIPHFFQDDIPCAFGGQPTSHTKTSCKSPDSSAKPLPNRASDHGPVRSDETHGVQDPPAPPPSPRQ
jgi:hypothetical protein